MSLPIPSFAALGPNVNMSTLDQQFAALAAASVISCTASGSNAVALTPMTNYPVPTGYTDAAPVFAWKQAQTSTGAVTINVAGLGAVNAYKNNGQTAVGATDLVGGAVYTAAYLGALNSGAGGIVVDVVPTSLTAVGPVQATFKNLVISVASNTTVSVTADAVTLFDGTNYSTVNSVNSTISTAASGVNGLDTGSLATATFYSIWVIQNTSSGASAAMMSASGTAPTMPAGYAKKARVGWVVTNTVNTNLLKTIQNGRSAQYIVTGSAPNASLPIIGTGSTGTINSTTFTGTLLFAIYAPNTAASIRMIISNSGSGTAIAVAPNPNYAGWGSATNPVPFVTITAIPAFVDMVLEVSAIYVASAGAGGVIQTMGWDDNI